MDALTGLALAALDSGINLDSVIEALFFLALAAIGILVMSFGTRIITDIGKLSDKMDKNDTRVGKIAQRLTNLDHRTESE